MIAAVAGDYGKPRPAVVVQSDVFPAEHASVIICPMTSSVTPEARDFRVDVVPSPDNGIRVASQIMADKPVTIRRERVAAIVGRLSATDMRRLNAALAFAIGLADGA